MSVVEVLELVAKLGIAAADAVRSGKSHVDVVAAFAAIGAGLAATEAKDDSSAAAEADAKYGKKV